MKKSKIIISATLIIMILFMLSGCLTTAILSEKIKYNKEQYCVVNMHVSGYESLNAHLYDLSHEYNVGIYIVDDFAPGVPNDAGEILYTEDGYAEQVLAAYDWLSHYDDEYVMLAIGNNVLAFGKGGDAFADISVSGKMQEVLTDDVCEKLESTIMHALDNAKKSDEESAPSIVSSDDYADILYDYIEELTTYLDAAQGQ